MIFNFYIDTREIKSRIIEWWGNHVVAHFDHYKYKIKCFFGYHDLDDPQDAFSCWHCYIQGRYDG
jgi:hypothetical protein